MFSGIRKISISNILPFVVWPILICVAFFLTYNRFIDLYLEVTEHRSENTSYEVEERVESYLRQIDNALNSSVSTLEYMIDQDASDEELLKFITYQSERLGIVSATGARGIFGVFRGSFLHGLDWNPENYDPTERVWYQEALAANGEYVFVGPYFNMRTDEYVVTAVKLLKDRESVIAFAIDYETFRDMTTSINDHDDDHMVLAMNDKGIVLANSDNDEIGEDYSTSEDSFKRTLYGAIMSHQDKSTFMLDGGRGIKDRYIVSRRHVLYNLYIVTVANADAELGELKRSVSIFGTILLVAMITILILNLVALVRDLKAKQRTENLNSIANIYATMHRIDVARNSYEQIACVDYKAVKLLGEHGENASQRFREAVKELCDDRSRESMLKFIDFSTLNERMRSKDTIIEEFLSYEHIWHRARFIVVERDSKNNIPDVIFATEIIDDEKRARDRFQYLAETDQLTGINNRGSGETKIRDLLLKNVGGMFILFDVDKFKYVNDNFGHDVGDEVLIAIGETMHRTFREKDIIMRLGGDEFAAYMPSVFTEVAGNQILDRFVQNIHKMKIPRLGDHEIDVSIGVAFYYPTDTFKFEELYRRADSCTYESKKVQGSEVCYYKRKDSEFHEDTRT